MECIWWLINKYLIACKIISIFWATIFFLNSMDLIHSIRWTHKISLIWETFYGHSRGRNRNTERCRPLLSSSSYVKCKGSKDTKIFMISPSILWSNICGQPCLDARHSPDRWMAAMDHAACAARIWGYIPYSSVRLQ